MNDSLADTESGNSISMKNLDIVFFDAASGHRSAAVALQKVLTSLHPNWNIRLINIVDIFNYHKRFGWAVRTGITQFNRELVKDKVFDLKGKINLALLSHDLVFENGIRSIARFWAAYIPDVVISVTPMYNPVLYKAAQHVNPNVKCITVPVDFEEVKSRYWFTPKVSQYYINATDALMNDAYKAGIHPEFLYRIPGMIVDPACYEKPVIDRREILTSLNLQPNLPTGFISFGGQGSYLSMEIAKAIDKEALNVNLFFLCGKNEKLYKDLTNFKTVYPKAVFSYLKETPLYYLHLSDFAIGKPGAMTITEALVTETPQIALKSTGMRPVQKGNETWLVTSGVGLLANNVQQVVPCLRQILNEPEKFKQNIAKHTHRGIFKCAETIKKIIS